MKGDEWVQGMTRRVLGYFSLFLILIFLLSVSHSCSLFFFWIWKGLLCLLEQSVRRISFLALSGAEQMERVFE